MLRKVGDILKKLNTILSGKQKALAAVVLCCSIIAAALEALGVSVIVPLINALISPEELLKNRYIAAVADIFDVYEYERLVIMVVVFVIIIYVIKNLFFVFNAWIKVKYSFKIQREMAIAMMKKYMRRGYPFFLDHNYGELRQGINGDVDSLYYIISNLFQLITQILMIAFIGIYMLCVDWVLALGAIISGGLCILLILLVFRKRMAVAGELLRIRCIKTEQTLEEILHGIKEVLISRRQKFFVNKYNREVIERNNVNTSKTMGAEIPAYLIEMISITGIMIILCIRVLSISDARSYVSVLGSFAVGMFRILPGLGKISTSINQIISSIPGLDSVYHNIVTDDGEEILGDEFDTDDTENLSGGEHFDKSIEIKEVSFKYANNSRLILDKADVVIPKGASVAFVGESGAGKSTLADVILGLLKPCSGEVLIDGQSIYDMNDTWWRKIGYIPQSIFLTDATILENVGYGLYKEDIDIDKAKRALEKADLWEYVSTLKDGLDTMIGDRGVRLSGGQRQRIGIARALYNSPEVLIMDEATSALDNETEKAVMESIDMLHGEITLVIIAHRLTTIKNCDYIYEINGGKAVLKTYSEITGQTGE